jgi:hypothetical protein
MKNYLKFIFAVAVFTVSSLTTISNAHALRKNDVGTCDTQYDENCGTDSNNNTICGRFTGPC